MSKKQTAVEYLQYTYFKTGMLYKTDFKKAIQMEREQIEKSYTSGREQWQKYEWDNSNYENDVEIPTPRKYYKETFGGQDE